MSKKFKEFIDNVKHMSKEDLTRQLYLATRISLEGIPWRKYDRENPPDPDKEYIVTDGASTQVSELLGLTDRSIWLDADFNVTHYAPINLPGEEEA